MNTQITAHKHSDHASLVATGLVGDFVHHEAEDSTFTDRITSILTVESIREITVESRITAYLRGGYQMTVDTTIHELHPNGGRKMRMGQRLQLTTTGTEPLTQDRLHELHTELLAS